MDNRIQVVIVDKPYLARGTYDGLVRMSERCALAAEQPSTDTFCNRTMSARHSRDDWQTSKKATCTQNRSRTRLRPVQPYVDLDPLEDRQYAVQLENHEGGHLHEIRPADAQVLGLRQDRGA